MRTLLDRGGWADVDALRRGLPSRSPPRATFERLVARSPLFVEGPSGRLHLIGHGPRTPIVEGRVAVAAGA